MKILYLDISPIEDGLHSQKLVFKVKIERGVGPRGGLGVRPPLEFEVFFHLKS